MSCSQRRDNCGHSNIQRSQRLVVLEQKNGWLEVDIPIPDLLHSTIPPDLPLQSLNYTRVTRREWHFSHTVMCFRLHPPTYPTSWLTDPVIISPCQ